MDLQERLIRIVAACQDVPASIITSDHWLGSEYLKIGKQVEQETGIPVLLHLNDGTRTKFSQLVAACQKALENAVH